jgi:hypothetical protein
MTGVERAVACGIDEELARAVCAALPEKYQPEKWTAAEWRAEVRRYEQLGAERYRQTLQLLEGLRQNYEQWVRRGQRSPEEQTADLSEPYSRQRQETGWSVRRPEERTPRRF